MKKEVEKDSAYLEKLYIKNFKQFDYLECSFEKGINLLVGYNNSGKSTIVEALDIILGERNLSPLSVNRSLFNSYTFGAENKLKLIAKVHFPESVGSKPHNKIDFMRQLKLGKGSSRSQLPKFIRPKKTDIKELTSDKDVLTGTYDDVKSKIDIESIFLITEISIDEEFEQSVEYKIILNSSKNEESWVLLGISGAQRSKVLNYLSLDSNRINNSAHTQFTEYSWPGRYFREYIKEKKLIPNLQTDSSKISLSETYTDPNIKSILQEIFPDTSLKIDIANQKDIESIIRGLKVYIEDGFIDEVHSKGQGIQSSTILSLFLAWTTFRAKRMPRHTLVENFWNTLIVVEEPESHFHHSLKNNFMSTIKSQVVDNGGQVVLSTHDSTFLEWQNSHNVNIIFPTSISEEGVVKNLSVNSLENHTEKRILRFSGKSLFSNCVLLVEGNEEICLEQVNSANNSPTFSVNGIHLARCIGGTRSEVKNNNQDKIPGGGKNDFPINTKFFESIGIRVMWLLDIDTLLDSIDMLKQRCNAVLKEEFQFDVVINKDFKKELSTYRNLWLNNRDLTEFKNIISQLEKAGIFFFPGDFESLFTENYLGNFGDHTGIIKEKHTYDVKTRIESGDFKGIFSESQVEVYKELVGKIIQLGKSYQTRRIIESEIEKQKLNDIPCKDEKANGLPF